jgi:hypothetical protein
MRRVIIEHFPDRAGSSGGGGITEDVSSRCPELAAAWTPIAEQQCNHVTKHVREDSRGQKRNREVVNNRTQMILAMRISIDLYGVATSYLGSRVMLALLSKTRESLLLVRLRKLIRSV